MCACVHGNVKVCMYVCGCVDIFLHVRCQADTGVIVIEVRSGNNLFLRE